MIDKTESDSAKEREKSQRLQQKSTILVVDDVAENLQIFSGMLRDHYQVKAALSGEKALQVVANHPDIDLILLDIMMPNMDGMEVCRRLKAGERYSEIPIIFLTAKNEVEDVTAGLHAGAVDYITKPVNPAILQARVSNSESPPNQHHYIALLSWRQYPPSSQHFLVEKSTISNCTAVLSELVSSV
ncbi:response regulator [Ectothiorhodospiraceae bacterium BW-2]|nr:response regulator [Ectothiorhodospiraceae bacterium BW-2]